MMIQLYLVDSKNALVLEEQYLCCYSGEEGAYIKDNKLIIKPNVKRIKCYLDGQIERCYLKDGKQVDEILTYDTVVVSNKCTIDTKYINTDKIKKIIIK